MRDRPQSSLDLQRDRAKAAQIVLCVRPELPTRRYQIRRIRMPPHQRQDDAETSSFLECPVTVLQSRKHRSNLLVNLLHFAAGGSAVCNTSIGGFGSVPIRSVMAVMAIVSIAGTHDLVAEFVEVALELLLRGQYPRLRNAIFGPLVEITVATKALKCHVPIRIQRHARAPRDKHVTAVPILN